MGICWLQLCLQMSSVDINIKTLGQTNRIRLPEIRFTAIFILWDFAWFRQLSEWGRKTHEWMWILASDFNPGPKVDVRLWATLQIETNGHFEIELELSEVPEVWMKKTVEVVKYLVYLTPARSTNLADHLRFYYKKLKYDHKTFDLQKLPLNNSKLKRWKTWLHLCRDGWRGSEVSFRNAFSMLSQPERKQTEESILSALQIMPLWVCRQIIESPALRDWMPYGRLFTFCDKILDTPYRGCKVISFIWRGFWSLRRMT
jgi:hypothetical protein